MVTLQVWHQYIEQPGNQFRYRCLRCENRCTATLFPRTRTDRGGMNKYLSNRLDQSIYGSPRRSMYGSSQSFNVNSIDFEQLVLVQFWLWVTTFFQRGTSLCFCFFYAQHCTDMNGACAVPVLKYSVCTPDKVQLCNFENVPWPVQKCRICLSVCRKNLCTASRVWQFTSIWLYQGAWHVWGCVSMQSMTVCVGSKVWQPPPWQTQN